MAFPTVTARTETALTTAGTTFTVNFTQTTGDLVVILACLASPSNPTLSDGFNDWFDISDRNLLIWKILTGSEGGNVALTISSSKGCAVAYNITDFNTTTPLDPSTFTSVSGLNPDPGNLLADAGAKDYLWIAAVMNGGAIEEADDNTWCNSAPANFTNLLQTTSGTGGAASSNSVLASAERQQNTDFQSPGTFNVDQAFVSGGGIVIAVQPLEIPQVPKSTSYPQLLAH